MIDYDIHWCQIISWEMFSNFSFFFLGTKTGRIRFGGKEPMYIFRKTKLRAILCETKFIDFFFSYGRIEGIKSQLSFPLPVHYSIQMENRNTILKVNVRFIITLLNWTFSLKSTERELVLFCLNQFKYISSVRNSVHNQFWFLKVGNADFPRFNCV